MAEKVLRSVLQKQGSGVFNGINYIFGSQGIYTEMFSGLNLEEQLLIGGAKEVSWEETSENYTFIEKYFLNSTTDEKYYQIKTEINKEIIQFLTSPSKFVVDGSDSEIRYFPFMVTEEQLSSNDKLIKITLSAIVNTRSDNDQIISPSQTVLKIKYIIFTYENGKRYISEVLMSPTSSVQ